MATIRRHIHNNPEPGFEEVKTNEFIRSVLTELAGIDPSMMRTCAKTGLVVDIKGEGADDDASPAVKTIALRADMDALRMTELNRSLPYRSSKEGVAHLCGHDGHMASLLGAAALIARRAKRLPCSRTVRLLFQPAEEGPGGALPMIAEGCLEGVDEVYGYHNWPSYPLGTLVIKPGPVMAHPSTFTIVVTGKGGHGSQPHVAVDPVLTAAHMVVALQSVVSRTVPSSEQAVVSVCMIHGGEAFNVIPDVVTLKGTIRDLSEEVCALVYARVRAIVAGVAATYGASADVTFDSMYAMIDNPPAHAEIVRELGVELLGARRVTDAGLPMLGAEDFSYYLHTTPGAFFFLGGNEERLVGWARQGAADGARSNCMCHNTAFDFNDNVAPLAATIFVRLVERRIGVTLYEQDELPVPLPEGAEDGARDAQGARNADGSAQAKAHKRGTSDAGPISLPPPSKKPRQ